MYRFNRNNICIILFLGYVKSQNNCRQKDAVQQLGGSEILSHLYPEDVQCGGIFDYSEDTISSPTIPYNDYYPNQCVCDYIIGSDYSGSYATITIQFLKLDIAGQPSDDICEDKLAIYSGKDLGTKLRKDICGNTLPPKLTRKVEFPVTLRFESDIDHRRHKGFKLDYQLSFENEGEKDFRISDPVKSEEKDAGVNLGLLFGIMAFLIAILIVALVIFKRQNEKLKTERDGPEPLQMSHLVMSADENIYEEIGPANNQTDRIIRTESQDSIAVEKENAMERERIRLLNESRQLPDLPQNDSSTSNNHEN